MKKTISLAICLVSGCLALTSCSNSSQPFTEKSYTPDAQIREVHLDVRDREIQVTGSEDGQVHIQYSESDREGYDISVSDDHVLTMTSAGDKAWTDYIGEKPPAQDRKILLQVPDALLKNLTLSTTNEDITLSPLTVTENLRISVNGGNIAFEKADVGNALALTVKNGDISGTVTGSYDDFAIQTEIKKGESNLPGHKENGQKTLTVSSNNGNVSIDFQKS